MSTVFVILKNSTKTDSKMHFRQRNEFINFLRSSLAAMDGRKVTVWMGEENVVAISLHIL